MATPIHTGYWTWTRHWPTARAACRHGNRYWRQRTTANPLGFGKNLGHCAFCIMSRKRMETLQFCLVYPGCYHIFYGCQHSSLFFDILYFGVRVASPNSSQVSETRSSTAKSRSFSSSNTSLFLADNRAGFIFNFKILSTADRPDTDFTTHHTQTMSPTVNIRTCY